ncbi:MAG: hypothetical protein KF681_15680 [Bdellovibrionaceae bacterium]|nr:hypothetical protein [Pseudobdellovibrionaceae bacterium]
MKWIKFALMAMTVLSFGQLHAQTYNDRDPNLNTFDGQYIDQYATPKSNPEFAQIVREKPAKAAECLDCRRSAADIHSQTAAPAPGAVQTPTGTGRGGGFEQGN